MTADAFTEAAQAAAREYARTPRMNVGTVRDRLAVAHADGWEAARAHLAAQESALRNRIAAEIRAGIAEYPLAENDPRDDYEIAADRVLAVLAARDVRGKG